MKQQNITRKLERLFLQSHGLEKNFQEDKKMQNSLKGIYLFKYGES